VNVRAQVWSDRLVTWSPVLLLGALAGLTYWLNAQVRLAAPAFDGSGRHDPDVFVETFRAINLDQDGRVRQALVADRAEHYPDDDTTAFDAPAITFTDPGKPRLDITSDHATVTGDRENVYFSGHVKAVREASTTADEKPDGPVTMTSDFLHVLPNEDRVVTDRAVTITEPHGTINAIGLELDNKAKIAKFGSHVTGQLQPQTLSR
jgi:lipopolysaccharide export system protein LptC